MLRRINIPLILVLAIWSCAYEKEETRDTLLNNARSERNFVVLENGDTLRTGIPVKLKKEEVSIDFSNVSRIKLGKEPKFIKSNNDIYPALSPKQISLPSFEEKLKARQPDDKSEARDTVLQGRILHVDTPRPVKAAKPYYRDNTKYNIQCYGVDQGLSSNYIYAVIEDVRGNIWLGTPTGGVTKFDGEAFTTYNEDHGFPSNEIWSILEDSKGNIWFLTLGVGVTKYDGKKFTLFAFEDGFISDMTYSILEDKQGNIWMGTDKGLAKYDGERFKFYTEKDGLAGNIVISMLEDSHGSIWLGTTSGMSVYRDSEFVSYTSKDGLPPQNIISIYEDRSGSIWFGTNYGGVCKYDDNILSIFTEKEGLINNSIKSIIQDENGDIWFGSSRGGLCKYNGSEFQHISIKDGLPSDRIRMLMLDSRQNLWAGTEAGGAFVFNTNSFDNYDPTPNPKESLISKQVLSYFEDKSGNLWYSTRDGVLNKFDGENVLSFGKEEGIDCGEIYSIIEDHNGHIWLGTFYGLIKYDGKNFLKYDDKTGLKTNRIISVLEDKNKNIWFLAYKGGVSRFDGKKITNYMFSENPKENVVFEIHEDQQGTIWMATEKLGLIKYNEQDDTFTLFTVNEGLNTNYIIGITQSKDGDFWLGTNKGASRFDGKHFFNVSKKEGLVDNFISSIVLDENENVWLATQGGISCIVYEEQIVSEVDPMRTIDSGKGFIVNYDKNDGLKSLVFSLNINNAIIDKGNVLRTGASTGWINLNLNTHEFPNRRPSLQLNTIEINENFIDFARLEGDAGKNLSEFHSNIKKGIEGVYPYNNYPEKLSLPYNYNHLNFKFTATDWNARHDIKYSYKVEGLDEVWSVPLNDNKADYRNIPPGNYTLFVKAIGKSGQWSEPLRYEFSITPPWWFSVWAIICYAILGIVLLIGSFKWYTYRMKRRQVILEGIVAERTQTIVEQKEELSVAYADLEQERNKMELKALLNQINPHFIFNALNSIQQFVLSNNVKTSLDYFNKFGKLIRSSLEHSEMKYVSIEEEIRVIKNYVDLENLRFSEPVALHFNTGEIDIYNIKIPPMFIQPIVENAIIHGLSKKETDKHIRMEFDEFDDYILCSIQDNGLGRKHKKSTQNKNSGLVITEKRLKSVWSNGHEKDFMIRFKDLKDPSGTRVEIKLPKDF